MTPAGPIPQDQPAYFMDTLNSCLFSVLRLITGKLPVEFVDDADITFIDNGI